MLGWGVLKDSDFCASRQSMSGVSAVPTTTAVATGKLRGAGERSMVARRSTSFVPGVSTAGAEGCHGEAMGVAMGVKVGEAMVWSVEAIGASRAVDRSVLTWGATVHGTALRTARPRPVAVWRTYSVWHLGASCPAPL